MKEKKITKKFLRSFLLTVIISGIVLIPASLVLKKWISEKTEESFEVLEETSEIWIRGDMINILNMAERIYDKDRNYNSVSCNHPTLTSFCDSIKNTAEKEMVIYSSLESFCAYVKLLSGNYYCIDNQYRFGATDAGVVRKGLIDPAGIGYCNGLTFVCPH